MSKVNDIIKNAQEEIGVKESPSGSNNVKYNTEYYGRAVSGGNYAWCAAFIWWVFKNAEASYLYYGGNKTAYCPTLMNFYKHKGQFSKTPRPGAIVFFDWNKNGTPDHVGIVEKINSGGSITTIEGNTAIGNDSNGGEVMRRTRYSSEILGYAYPYDNTTSSTTTGGSSKVNVTVDTVKNGSKGDSVKALQILLNGFGYSCGTADGIAGTKTVAAIKKLQKAKGLTVDGIAGAKTWNAVLN